MRACLHHLARPLLRQSPGLARGRAALHVLEQAARCLPLLAAVRLAVKKGGRVAPKRWLSYMTKLRFERAPCTLSPHCELNTPKLEAPRTFEHTRASTGNPARLEYGAVSGDMNTWSSGDSDGPSCCRYCSSSFIAASASWSKAARSLPLRSSRYDSTFSTACERTRLLSGRISGALPPCSWPTGCSRVPVQQPQRDPRFSCGVLKSARSLYSTGRGGEGCFLV